MAKGREVKQKENCIKQKKKIVWKKAEKDVKIFNLHRKDDIRKEKMI